MSAVEIAIAIFGALLLYTMALPALSAELMFRGLNGAKFEKVDRNLCYKVTFISVYASFFIVFVAHRYLSRFDPVTGRLISVGVMAGAQALFAVILMKNWTAKGIGIEVAAVLAANAAVFGVNALINPLHAGAAS